MRLKKLVKELELIRGRHTELVTVYIPSGSNLQETIAMLRQEYSLAQNVKDKTVRKNVSTALEKIIHHLQLFKVTPENGLVIFCGNVSDKEGVSDIKIWSIEPPEKLTAKIYRCDQVFILDPLKEMLREREVFGLIVLDAREANIGLLKGKALVQLKKLESTVPSKSIKGGMCVDPETLVLLHDGRIVQVSELAEQDNPIICANFDNFKTIDATHAHIIRSKIDGAIKIKTKAPGFEITASPDHRFFTFSENGIELKYAKELKPNDNLFAVKRISVKSAKPKLNVQLQVNYKITQRGREFLAKLRKNLGIPQHKVAKSLHVTQTTISKFELGERNLTIDKLKKLISLYGLNEKKFFSKFMKQAVSVKFPKNMTLELCQLLGYMLGDGTKDGNRIILYDKDESLLDKYRKIVIALFNVNTSKKYRKRERGKKGSYELKIYSKELLRIIDSIFDGILSKDRKIPEIIQRLPNKYLAKFISGLFDAEGYVERGGVGITMSNKRVIQMLQLLLLRFGIISSYREELCKRKYMKYRLQISDFNSIKTFKKLINFLSESKRAVLNRILKKRTIKSCSDQIPVSGKFIINLAKELKMNTESFPRVQDFFYDKKRQSFRIFKKEVLKYFKRRLNEIKNAQTNDLREFRKRLRITLKEVANKIGYTQATICDFEKGRNKNKKLGEKIKKALEMFQAELAFKAENTIELLEQICSGDLIQTKVAKVEKLKTQKTFFDITVPRYENFIANGIIVHNSQARYDRIREDAINEFLTKVAETASELLLKEPELKGVIVGGPGYIKEQLIRGDYLHHEIRKKLLGVKDTGYTGEEGLQELVKRSSDLIEKSAVVKEREILEKFFSELQKDGNIVYGFKETLKALEQGAIDILLISEAFDVEEIEKLTEKAKSYGTKVELVSIDTSEGAQFKELGGIGGFLRFKI